MQIPVLYRAIDLYSARERGLYAAIGKLNDLCRIGFVGKFGGQSFPGHAPDYARSGACW